MYNSPVKLALTAVIFLFMIFVLVRIGAQGDCFEWMLLHEPRTSIKRLKSALMRRSFGVNAQIIIRYKYYVGVAQAGPIDAVLVVLTTSG